MWKITDVYKYLVPFGTPAPSAFVMGISLYNYMANALSKDFAWLVLPIVIAGILGMEGVGGMSSILVSRAYVIKKWDIMGMAIVAVFGYAAFVAIGIYTGNDSVPLLMTVAMTLLGYGVMALFEGMQAEGEKVQAVIATTQSETERLEAQRKLTNSQIRLAKTSSVVQSVSSLSSGQSGQLDPAKLAWVKAYCDDPLHKGHSLETMVAAPGCPFSSRETARKYRSEVTK